MGLPVDIAWITAFLDLPADRFEIRTRFWEQVTGTVRSAARGDNGEFATLTPPAGDPHLRVQRVAGGPGGVHLDLHVADVVALAERARTAGADLGPIGGFVPMRSPGGLPFCAVADRGEVRRADPVDLGRGAAVVDQVSIDIPADRFDDEVRFWVELTGWELRSSAVRPEFSALVRSERVPVRLLFQRLEERSGPVRAHLDVAAGDAMTGVVADHVQRGASIIRIATHWTTLQDPGGGVYCITRRAPATGLLG
ncbi:MAG: VOC family protein [Actinomycetota bacterium]